MLKSFILNLENIYYVFRFCGCGSEMTKRRVDRMLEQKKYGQESLNPPKFILPGMMF
jgi:hypothetical protein